MRTFLIVVVAVVAGLALSLSLAWWWLKRKLSGLGEALAALASAPPPPFRITVVASPDGAGWTDAEAADTASAGLVALGYERAGDFTVPEMDDLRVRGFAHPGWSFYAAIYEHPAVGVIADVVCNLADGSHFTVSTSPESGLDAPPGAPIVRLPLRAGDSGTAGELHERLRSEVSERPRLPAETDRFASVFIEAYRYEMDFRIARLGPTEAEIRRIAEISGQDEPDEQAVAMIQAMWRGAIEDFVEDEVREAYLSRASLSASEWEEKRDRLYVVHEHLDPASRMEILAWEIAGDDGSEDWKAQERAQEAAKERLEPIFRRHTLREAFAAAQDLLPATRKYEQIGTVTEPWEADLYLMPEADCGDT